MKFTAAFVTAAHAAARQMADETLTYAQKLGRAMKAAYVAAKKVATPKTQLFLMQAPQLDWAPFLAAIPAAHHAATLQEWNRQQTERYDLTSPDNHALLGYAPVGDVAGEWINLDHLAAERVMADKQVAAHNNLFNMICRGDAARYKAKVAERLAGVPRTITGAQAAERLAALNEKYPLTASAPRPRYERRVL